MKYRELGSTGITVSEVGFGTWGLGGDSYGPMEDGVAIETLRAAYESGVTFYDTSDLYGGGRSEELISMALKGMREKIVIGTKVGMLPHHGFEMPQDFSRDHIRNAVEASLERLQTDYIDLYQLHSPPIEVLEEDDTILDTLESLKEEGKIRRYGISARSPGDGLLALEKYGFEVIQVNFNLIDQRAVENGLFELSGSMNAGIIVRTPLCFGYLTGQLNGEEHFEGIDHRANWPAEQLRRWARAPDLFSFLNQGKDRTPAQLAIKFCLSFDSVSTVIPGMMNRLEVEENTQVSDKGELSEEEQMRINLVYDSHVFYDPSAKIGEIKS